MQLQTAPVLTAATVAQELPQLFLVLPLLMPEAGAAVVGLLHTIMEQAVQAAVVLVKAMRQQMLEPQTPAVAAVPERLLQAAQAAPVLLF